MGRGRFRKQLIAFTALWFTALCCFAGLHTDARESDAMRRANERAREIVRQQQERERDRQERERERQERERERQARERSRQEREQAREERAQTRREQAEDNSKDRQSSTNSNTSQDDSASNGQAKAGSAADTKSQSAADKARADKVKPKVDVVEEEKEPETVAEWFRGIFKPAAPAPVSTPVIVIAPAIKTPTPQVNVPPAKALPAHAQPVVVPIAKTPLANPAPVNAPLANAAKGGVAKPVSTTGSTPVKAESAPSKAPVATPPAAPAVAAKGGSKPITGRPVGRDGLPAFPLRPPEVLASNLTAKSIERALALGFQVNGTSRVSRVDLNLTRLIAPDGVSADQALDLLKQDMPNGLFGVNQTYRIYRTATGALPASQSEIVRAALPMATPCGTDRCFGASIIHWQASLQSCSRGVKIGVIDTGYDATHPTFTTKVIESRRSTASDRAKSPDWHGTGVLALLAGDGNSGTPGLIPDAKFYVADIFYAGADGLPSSDTASLLNALDWLDKRNVNVINMSLSGPPDDLLKAAIEGLSSKKVIFVAAAGNDGPNAPPSYPAAYGSVVAVTAVSRDMKGYRYASRGDHIDVAAPGVDIWTALPGGRGTYHSGTSFAVPYVTAVLATAYRGLVVKNKTEFLKRASVLDLGEPGRDPIYGRGLLLAPPSCAPETAIVATASPVTATVTPVKAQLAPPVGLIGQAKPPR